MRGGCGGGRVRPPGRAVLLAGAVALLAGCVERGDFGRAKPSVWNEAVAATGAMSAAGRGEPVSLYPFTDDETEMRDRAWRFLVPARNRPWLDRLLAELVATRVLPADLAEPEPRAYSDGLRELAIRSPVALYRRLSEDVSADLRLVGPFAAVAARVLAADRRRLQALSALPDAPAEAGDATARVAENRCLVAWVTSASAFRVESYAYALRHLFVAAPGPDALPTERIIGRLATERTRLDALGVQPLAAASCAGETGVAIPAEPAVHGAVLMRKG